ncbi:MAG: NAD(P)-dependent oxidoreductase, partial [Planctomycetota bacterium]|nr:NAD(P)-dependent oxidoreductase [Planctomycetota bacterium]
RMLAEAALAPPGAGGMVSTFGAEVMDGRALSLPVGELSLSHLGHADPHQSAANLARAVIEGMAFALRANLEQAAVADAVELRLGGRMASSSVWQACVAAALGRPVAVGEVFDSTGLGAALCAGVGAGCFPDLAAAAAALVKTRSVEPEADEATVLAELYTQWSELLEARRPAVAVSRGLALRGLLQSGASATAAASAPGDLRILVTADMDEESLAAFQELGEVEYASYREARRLLTGPTLVEALADVDVFVTEIDLVDAASLLELPRLRVVASCRGDAVNVDVEACSVLGLPVLNAPGRNADAVADLTVAFLLALARKLPDANAFLREPGMEAGDMGAMGRAYGSLRGQELWRRTIGLVGLGAVGRKVAERLVPFGVRLLAHDPWQDPAAITRAGASAVSLEALLAESDFVSLHAAVTEDTTGLIDAAALARMKPGAMLVNTARAALVDEEALADALQSGHLAGAALDVFSEEPPGADHPLLAAPGVIATPHVGGNTLQIGAHQGRIVSEDLARLVRGEPPRCALNPETALHFDWRTPRTGPDEATCCALRERPGPAVKDLKKKKPTGKARRKPGPVEERDPVASPLDPALRDELRRGMTPVLEAFVRAFSGDASVQGASRDQDVTLYFVLEDLGLDFHLRLREEASAALGPPDGEPEVTLRLRAEVLDGMFSGRLRAMDEALAGNLSFSGDTAKAMTLQQLEDDLVRLYSAARAAAGPPGDLARTAPT